MPSGDAAPAPRRGVRPSAALALLLLYCGVLIARSTPRRVGDGVEYWAMADQLRLGQAPSISPADLIRLRAAARTIGHGFDQSPLAFPLLIGHDGRQDFPHFWLYPLVSAPAMTLVTWLGIHPNWAFTLTNVLLLALAFAIVARHVSIAWAALLLGGPLVWWVDKAHSDVFTVSLLAIACACWRIAPPVTVLASAAAAAQNPALMPVWLVVALGTSAHAWSGRQHGPGAAAGRQHGPGAAAGGHNGRPGAAAGRSHAHRSLAAAIVAGAAIVALPLLYYRVRLGVWSPLIGYTSPALPSLRTVCSLLLDPNIGLVPNAPVAVLAASMVLAGTLMVSAAERQQMRWALITSGVAVVLMLSAFAQSINMNHGATPGMNRWTLWLTPWILLVRSPTPRSRPLIWAVLVALNCLWSVCYFRPSLAENYRYPTSTARWLWTYVPGWYSPAPEIFAERLSHREPPYLPTASPDCGKVLLVAGLWPDGCPPAAPAPPPCLGRDQLCYATPDAYGHSATFTVLGRARFPWTPAHTPAVDLRALP